MEWIFFSLALMVVWLLGMVVTALWVVRRVIPGLIKEMDEQGLNDIQKQMVLNKAMFPPRFRR